MLAWEFAWAFLCAWTPKPLNAWRITVLKSFGARVNGRVFIHQRARIQIPWNLVIHDRATVGDRANLYTLGEIEICEGATIAQEVYLCTGTHAFDRASLNLMTAKIKIGADAFVGARAFIMPGVEIGARSIVGACSVVTKDTPEAAIVAGSPGKIVGSRTFT